MKTQETAHTDRIGIGLVNTAVHRAGWIFREQAIADHGIDAHIESVFGETATGRLIALQIKSGKSYFSEATESGYVFRGDAGHLEYWINHSLPVLILLVDVDNEQIYWEHVTDSNVKSTGKGWKIEVPRTKYLESKCFKQLGELASHRRHFPQSLIDEMILGEVEVLRKKRFFPEFDREGCAKQLGGALVTGHLAGGSNEARARGLAWCARFLARSDDVESAENLLERSQALFASEEAEIAKAFIVSSEGQHSTALDILNGIQSKAALTATLMIEGFESGEEAALGWLKASPFSASELDSDGRWFLLNLKLSSCRWGEAIALREALDPMDHELTPVLRWTTALLRLLEAVPDELRHVVVGAVPFEGAEFPLVGGEAARVALCEARQDFEEAAAAGRALGLEQATKQAEEYILWLSLVDPETRDAARSDLEDRLRDAKNALGVVSLALQFGVSLDLAAVERAIERQMASGDDNAKIDAAKARFALTLMQSSPREAASYAERHFADLCGYLKESAARCLQVELWAKAGSVERANEFLVLAVDEGVTADQEARLRRMISEAEGSDPVEARRAQFEATGDLQDLVVLVETLIGQEDWESLCKYGKVLYRRTASRRDAERLSGALLQQRRTDELVELFSSNDDLRQQSPRLQLHYCWALFLEGELCEARLELDKCAEDFDAENYRTLEINLTIGLGEWERIPVLVAREFDERDTRSAAELVAAAQIGAHVGSPHVRDLLSSAVGKAGDDAEIYASAYFLASSADMEDEPEVSTWLHEAARLSTDGGPIHKATLKEIDAMRPAWEERESETWSLLSKGEIPQYLAAQHLNKSLVEVTTFPSLSNSRNRDVRKRFAIPAFAGNRASGDLSGCATLGLEATALLTLGSLGLLEKTVGAFERVYLPHATLVWLFEEKQKVAFHQPSQIRNARRLVTLLPAGHIEMLASSVVPSSDLAGLVGDDLATLIAEASASGDDSTPQGLVIRPGPIHVIGSLMDEEADMAPYEGLLCSCGAVVDKMAEIGGITAEVARRARSYLQIQERRWSHEPEISDGARLYLDGLAVTYLRHTGILGELHSAGFKVFVCPSEFAEADQLIRYEDLSSSVKSIIDSIRNVIRTGLASGKVHFDRQNESLREKAAEPFEHPSLAAYAMAGKCDVIVTDDRFMNRCGHFKHGGHSVPIATSLDVLQHLVEVAAIARQEAFACRTQLRRQGYLFVPLQEDEVANHLKECAIADGQIRETAELKAIRESILLARMRGWLQLPAEWQWLNSTMATLRDALMGMWSGSDGNVEEMRTRSSWILNLLEFRGWKTRGEAEDQQPAPTAEFTRAAGVASLLVPNRPLSAERMQAFWSWLQEELLEPMKEQEPEAFAALVEISKDRISNIAQKASDQVRSEQNEG